MSDNGPAQMRQGLIEWEKLRASSIAEYNKACPVTLKPHDWRYASDAPGWKIGDACARCQACGLKAIRPNVVDKSPIRRGEAQ